MLYLDKNLVDMSRIGKVNYQDHGWRAEDSPEKASIGKGEKDVYAVIAHLQDKIKKAMGIYRHHRHRGKQTNNTALEPTAIASQVLDRARSIQRRP